VSTTLFNLPDTVKKMVSSIGLVEIHGADIGEKKDGSGLSVVVLTNLAVIGPFPVLKNTSEIKNVDLMRLN